jgi:acyl-CoA dehydrogenase
MAGGLEPTIEQSTAVYNLSIPVRAERLLARVKDYITEEVEPVTREFFELGRGRADPWSFAPGQLDVLNTLKQRAKDLGLWNLFLPQLAGSNALSNLEYAYVAFELGKNPLASESLNCSAPDTGNIEVLLRVGTATQKRRWLDPLLDGEIRSAFAMTEPDVASSDAKNISCRAELDRDEWVINGEKYFVTGAGDPRCEFLIVMVRTNASAPRHLQHSQLIVPMGQPGVEKVGPMLIFGHDDAPYGHFHLRFNDVRVPRDHVLLGEGRGFEVSQLPAAHRPRQEHGADLPRSNRHRSNAPHRPACSAGDGPSRQSRGERVGFGCQGARSRDGLSHHRRSNASTWRSRRLSIDTSG